MSEWWVGRRGADPVGPVSTETLVRGVKEKKVPPNALVCRVGEQQWHHVAQVDELWDRINPDEARTAVTEKPWFGSVSDSHPPADTLADAEDGDEAATRIYDTRMMSNQSRTNAHATAQATATDATDSPTVPLVTSSTLGSSPTAGSGGAERPIGASVTSVERAAHPSISKPSPVKAAAPAFRPPASLTAKAARSDVAAAEQATSLKENPRSVKAVIPAPRFGVDRVAPSSPPIAAGAFMAKPPSVRPEPMRAETAVAASSSATKQSTPPPATQSPQSTTRQSSPPPASQSSPPPARNTPSSVPPRESAAAAARQTMAIASRHAAAPVSRQNGVASPRQAIATSPRENAAPAAQQNRSPTAHQATAPTTRQHAPSPARLSTADKSRQPIPPVPAAVIPLPPDSELAALVRDNADVCLTETRPDRPDRRVTKDSDVLQRKPVARPGTSAVRDTVAQKPNNIPRAEFKQAAPRPTAGAKPVPDAMPRIEAKPIVAVADADDDDATVIRDIRREPLSRPQQRPPDDDDDATVIRQQVVNVQPAADEDETVVLRQQPNLPSADSAALDAEHIQPRPAISTLQSEQVAQHPVPSALQQPDEQPLRPGSVQSGERPISPQIDHARAVVQQRVPQVAEVPSAAEPSPHRPPPEPQAHDLFDEDDEPLPARARDYAGAHGPPSSSDTARPRPAAGTPAPPSVIVSQQHHVPMDSLGRVIQPHAELTRPALRTIRPPGTIQISIATLIVGAMTLIVIVLTAVLLLR